MSEILNNNSEVSLFWEPLNSENLDVSIDKLLITVHIVYTNDGSISQFNFNIYRQRRFQCSFLDSIQSKPIE